MPKKQSRKLTQLERTEAKLVIEEMLCKRTNEKLIVQAIQENYAIKKAPAQRLLAQAIAEMQARVKANAPHRREQQIASLERLYELTLDAKKYSTAVMVQRLLAKIEGTEKPTKLHHTGIPAPSGSSADAEMEDRTVDDLEYYADKGHWPEDAGEDETKAEESGGQDFPLH